MTVLGTDHQEVLAELFNIGMGHAGAVLSRVVHGEYVLSVPRTEVAPRSVAIGRVVKRLGADLCTVSRRVAGAFDADIALVMAAEHAHMVARHMMGDAGARPPTAELEADSLKELGNVMLSSCVDTLSNMVGVALQMSVPEARRGSAGAIFGSGSAGADEPTFCLHIDFGLKGGEVGGSVMFLVGDAAAPKVGAALALYLKALA
ncbi:MAG: hypothetical protein JNK11_04170 [Alphaproteobacteria bacterium]|nr:hypothetical protein [Alphaproteobacteria bacterium]